MVPLACINAGQYWKGQDRQFHKDMTLLTTRARCRTTIRDNRLAVRLGAGKEHSNEWKNRPDQADQRGSRCASHFARRTDNETTTTGWGAAALRGGVGGGGVHGSSGSSRSDRDDRDDRGAGLYRNDRRAGIYRDDRRAGLGWNNGRTGPGRNHRGPGSAGVVAAGGSLDVGEGVHVRL